jgi:iron complex outermembrane receptor protein
MGPEIGRSRRIGATTWLVAAALLWPLAVASQPTGPPTTLPPVEVIGASPLLGSGIDRDKLPANVRSLGADELRREGSADLTGTLQRRIPSIAINDVQANPFQPDIQFRGFTASPVIGTPQGIAVYQNGVRVNEAFGDTVNWDLIPDVAINRLNLVSNNPVFGLNALGGALAVEMKNGFTFQGLEGEIRGGSFGRRAGSAQYGLQSGPVGFYVAGEMLNEDGWRDQSQSELRRLYADLGGKRDAVELHLSLSAAANRFGAIGPTPVELLDRRRASVYTTPQTYHDDLVFLTLAGSYEATETLSFQGNLYYRAFRQRIVNGNTSDIQPCDPGVAPGTLCLDDPANILFSVAGTPVPDTLGGAVPGTIDRNKTSADVVGGSLQVTSTAPVFERGNHLVVGASLDHGIVDFSATSELGTIGADLFTNGTGVTIQQPDGSITPVRLHATNDYVGVYATDTLDLTPALAATLGGRFNFAQIHLSDRLGASLNGNSQFSRFNPAAGLAYKLTPSVTAYAGYSEANRAPTALELACADPARPCTLENFLVSDPPLKQVVAHTWETGLRGGFNAGEASRVTWNLGLFRTDNTDDIINVASPIVTGRGFFMNAGETRRQGIEAGVAIRAPGWSAYLDYGLVDATFQSKLTLNAPQNPASVGGLIFVKPGDTIPAIPTHRLKLGAEVSLAKAWTIGADLNIASEQYLRGDESNLNPKIGPHAIVNLHTSYRVSENFEVFGLIQNLFDTRYETFGTFFDPAQVPFLGLTNPRTLSPGAPLGAFAGVRVTF